ncbi:MAG: ferritin [Elusimicrobiales bacterium]
MTNPRIEAAFNEQIKFELESAFIYYQMAGWLAARGYGGMAGWMLAQKDEELSHAHKFFAHIASRGGMPKFAALSAPKNDWKSPHDIFAEAYKHEVFISGRIDALAELARKESDNAALEFLQWFVKEQVEEEESTNDIAQKLERVGPSGSGLVMMDKELGKRKSA